MTAQGPTVIDSRNNPETAGLRYGAIHHRATAFRADNDRTISFDQTISSDQTMSSVSVFFLSLLPPFLALRCIISTESGA